MQRLGVSDCQERVSSEIGESGCRGRREHKPFQSWEGAWGAAHLVSRHQPGEQMPLVPTESSGSAAAHFGIGPHSTSSYYCFLSQGLLRGRGLVCQPGNARGLTHGAGERWEPVGNIPTSYPSAGQFCRLSGGSRETYPQQG